MLYGLALLLVFQLLGEAVVQWVGLPVPGPLLGMLMLFGALVLRGGLPEGLDQAGGALLQNMMLLFVPAVAGVTLHFERLDGQWLAFLVALLGSMAITMAVTALLLRWLLRRLPPDEPPAP